MIDIGFKYLYKDTKTAMYRFNQAFLLDSTNSDIYWGYGAIYFILNNLELATELSSGNSIEISGTFNDGISDYPFEFTSTMHKEYEIENDNGINVNLNETASFVLFLQLESLFNGVDFSHAKADTDDIVRINPDSNSEIASLIESNFEKILDFEDEHDDDDHN